MADQQTGQWVFRCVVLGSDHAGFGLKERIKERLSQKGIRWTDLGTHHPEPCDYPDTAYLVATAVGNTPSAVGILLCGTGIGSAIAANKVPGIRCALCWNEFTAKMARSHNDANILALGARVIGEELAWAIVETFLSTPFSGEERHRRRIEKIHDLEATKKPVARGKDE
ncbi:MAG: ribose 5-phosphate isomerase B [Armatimonadetes bacterium]|nr:ribose 5-phosphate isomerase B [Armatimonadota bacterium]MDW8122338.1 ribose 5-phosphate isomerase B [Armatimonadota bacterium]